MDIHFGILKIILYEFEVFLFGQNRRSELQWTTMN